MEAGWGDGEATPQNIIKHPTTVVYSDCPCPNGVQAQARKKKIAKAQIQLAELRAQTRGADLQSFSIGYQSGLVPESKIVPY